MVRSLLLLIILCLAGFFLYPLAVQRTTSECRALRLETAPRGSQGTAAPAAASVPETSLTLPAWAPYGWQRPFGCTWLYWHQMFDPPG